MKITKALKKQFEDKARTLVKEYNPYIEKSIQYAIGGTPMYLYANQSMTREQIDSAYVETAVKDMEKGYEERMVGYYDKWYRYSHADEGRAYDEGQKMATENPKCSAEFHIIEIAECNK